MMEGQGSSSYIWYAAQTFSFGNLTPPNPRLVDHRISGAGENSHIWQWLSYCYKTDLNENLISFYLWVGIRGAVWRGFPAVKTENKSSLCALWDIKVSDLNCFSLEGEWLYRLCETDPWSGLGTVLLSLKTTRHKELDEEVDWSSVCEGSPYLRVNTDFTLIFVIFSPND